MAVSDFVTFTIEINNAGLSEESFGTPLLVSYSAPFSGVRSYGQYADVIVDFAAGTPEADMADAIFSQSPHPTTFKIGAGTLKPTLEYAVGAIQVNASYPYAIQIDGPGITSTDATYTSSGSPTIQAIHQGLITALNAVVGKNYTAAFAPLASLAAQTFVVASQSSGTLTITAHGLNTGDGPIQVSEVGGALPTGLTASTNYWVIKVDVNTIALASSLANALAGTFIVLSSNGSGTMTETPQAGALSPVLPFLVTASAAGDWFSLDIQNPSVLSNKMAHSDPGVATDLANLANLDSDWYWLLGQFNSKAVAEGMAGWTEANGRAFVISVVDTDAVNTNAGNEDTLDALCTLNYKRTCGKYHNSPLECFDGASVSAIAPLNPGTWTEAFKTLSGVAAVNLTSTQRTNLRARRSGTYTTEKGRSITWDGKVMNTVYGYLDITVAIDWFSDQVVTAAFGVLVSMPKVAYTDEDIDTIAGAIRGVLLQASSDANPVLDPGDPSDPENPPPSITFPTVASISPATRALRQLPNGNILGVLQGAVQTIAFNATLTF